MTTAAEPPSWEATTAPYVPENPHDRALWSTARSTAVQLIEARVSHPTLQMAFATVVLGALRSGHTATATHAKAHGFATGAGFFDVGYDPLYDPTWPTPKGETHP